MREKRTCQNDTHPFKQAWYWFTKGEWSDVYDEKYCSSCAHLMRTTEAVFQAMISPQETLYGNEYIRLSREQLHFLLDEAYDSEVE